MPVTKKQNKTIKKKKKKTKNVKKNIFKNPPVITEEQKEFYVDQINSLEPRLIR